MAQYYRRRISVGMFNDIVKGEKLTKQYGVFRFSHINRAPLTDDSSVIQHATVAPKQPPTLSGRNGHFIIRDESAIHDHRQWM
ncbi:hypothetical protein [Bifidobacterium jacchi]|uniref:hypothetical protein n=1 Tax=Bifidobacterium jacchi TaxID=2490545 RepID=UPI00158812FD|nr:hypothetical protein [Bifidobacterium jacchi]